MECNLADEAKSWNTTDATIQTYWKESVLCWTPIIAVVLGTPLHAVHFKNRTMNSCVSYFKLIITALIAAISIGTIGYVIHDALRNYSIPNAISLWPVFLILIMTFQLFESHKKGTMMSSVSWFLPISCLAMILGILVRCFYNFASGSNSSFIGDTTYITQIIILVLYLLLVLTRVVESIFTEAQCDEDIDEKTTSPQTRASFMSLLTFNWITPLILKGYKNTLERKDLWPLTPDNTSTSIISRFERYWHQEVESAKRKMNTVESKQNKKDSTVPQASLLFCICKVYAPILLVSALYKLLFHVSELVCPFVLRWLITFTERKEEEAWKGYLFSFLMFGITVFKSLVLNHHIQKTQVAGRRNWMSLTAAIYKKTLKLSSSARTGITVGETINLISVDAGKISDCMWSVNDVWAVPMLFTVSFYFLWHILGPSVLVGVIFIAALIPINAVLMRKSRALIVDGAALTDARIKMMNEVLNGIKVLKMYAWEESFEKQILDIRNQELNLMTKNKVFESWQHFIWATSPFMVSFCTFGTFVLLDQDNVLTAEKAFVSLYLFHTLHWALREVPHVISNFIQASVSLKRIQTFLNSDDLDEKISSRNSDYEYGVTIEDGTFYWNTNKEPTLKNINIKIPERSLVAVVGSVGAGKSSLLSAMLGEMASDTAKVKLKGSVAYVAQQAWIMNTTLRNNVLFGKEYNKKKYDCTIEAAAFQKDLDMLSGGDQTEIGEKGINLSGGQKQRVSLARAVYQDADIYLLDDPLSAVDSHVGKHIFEKIIASNGLLKNKTRILVTHGIHFLPKVDIIITLVDGKIGEIGSFKELVGHNGAFAEFLKTFMTQELTCCDADEEFEALEMTQELENQLDDDGNSGILKRTLSEIAKKKKSEKELSIGHQAEIGTIGTTHCTRQSSSTRNISRQPSKIASDTSSRKPSDIDMSTFEECYLDQMAFFDHHFDSMFNVDEEVFQFKRQMSEISNATLSIPERKQFSRQSSMLRNSDTGKDFVPTKRLIEDENIETGLVKLSVVMMYARAVGLKLSLLIYVVNMIHETAETYLDVWVSNWVSDQTTQVNGTTITTQKHMRVFWYGFIGLVRGLLILLTELLVSYGLVKASKRLHLKLLRNILKLPMNFFDTTPVGRIVNRFSKDIEVIDDQIIYMFKDSYISLFCCVGNMLIISIGTPQFLLVMIPVTLCYFYVQRLFASTSRQLRRLESAARSPIYAQFGETISGCSTIRAYKQQSRFMAESAHRCDELNTCQMLTISAGKWLYIRLEFLGSIIVLFASLFAVSEKDHLSSGIVGLAITYALRTSGTLQWLVRRTSDLETNIISVERIKEYSETPTEADWIIEEKRPTKTWPGKGVVEINDYGVRYREGLDLVLKGITCKIQSGEKVGIVGRTGAGKSSLTIALFRILEKAQGTIAIDGIDISTIGLHDLRSRITIIPQDPVLFSGTMRMNLDPFGEYTNEDIWKALEHAHLKTFVSQLEGKLEFVCSEGGENLSVGQRQLVCLARALLRKTKILVLDEATAAVDLETDELIQKTIRKEFNDCTIMTIAHRLNTIMDYDRIMVLDNGSIREFDSPSNLLNDNKGIFYEMSKDAGLLP